MKIKVGDKIGAEFNGRVEPVTITRLFTRDGEEMIEHQSENGFKSVERKGVFQLRLQTNISDVDEMEV